MGRPRIEIDPGQVERMARMGLTRGEIAEILGCSLDTLRRRCGDVMARGRALLCYHLRRWQLKAAKQGNASLLIWLGKQYLGQRDNPIDEDPADTEWAPTPMEIAAMMSASVPDAPDEGDGDTGEAPEP